jgi:flagellar motor switch/type III secretory pathway protein FliN
VNVTPYHLLKHSLTQRLSAQAGAALSAWTTAWCPHVVGKTDCAPADAPGAVVIPSVQWTCHAHDGGERVWVAGAAGSLRHLEKMLFGLDEVDAAGDRHLSSSIAGDVVDRALGELLASLIHALTGLHTQPAGNAALPVHLLQRGSGAVRCTVSFGEQHLVLIVPPESLPSGALAPLRTARPPVRTLNAALANVSVRLRVEAAQTEMTLGYLGTLALGDVLTLPVGIHAPMRVTVPGGATLCHAHLGTLAGFHAIELIGTR